MEKVQLDNLLAELYEIDPSLKKYGDSLRSLVLEMLTSKPDTKFDGEFAARLKQELAKKISASKTEKTFSIFSFLKNKRWYFTFAGLAVCGFAVLLVLVVPRQEDSINPIYNLTGPTVSLEKHAFGPLATMENAASNFGMGAGNNTVNAVAKSAPTRMMVTDAVNQKAVAPSFSIQYVYAGDNFNLTDQAGLVYRRVKGNGELAKSLMKSLQKGNFEMMDLNSFQNLKLTNLSFLEDRDSGLMINFDFVNDNFYFSENSEKWQAVGNNTCGLNKICDGNTHLDDIPADNLLIEKANNFFKSHKINLENYGAPIVDNSWRASYEQTVNKESYSFPEYINIVYPLLVGKNREEVYDQSGALAGLRASINLSRNAISNVDGLAIYHYQSSEYELVTDMEAIIKVAEKGGWNQISFASTNVKKVSLGTPKRALVQLSRFSNNQNEELLVPALIFPVADGQLFYGRSSVVVPLVKEIFNELK